MMGRDGTRSALAAIAIFTFVAGGVAAAPANAAEGPDSIPGITDSSRLTNAVFADGVVLDADGTRAEAGELVVLRAWPSHGVMERLQEGETVKMLPVATAVTGADGTFELRISDTETTARLSAESDSGSVDFEIVRVGEKGISSYSFSANPSVDGKAMSQEDAAVRAQIEVPAVVNVDPRFLDERDSTEKATFCSTVKYKDLGARWVSVGYGYNTAPSGTMTFKYTSGSSSTLGTAISASGGAGTFTVSGSMAWSSSTTQTYPATTSFKVWKTQFRYGSYHTTCTTNGVPTSSYYTARPDGYVGGTSVQTVAGAPAATKCASYVAGSSMTKSTTAAYTGSGGVDISATLGINLSAKTGYTSSTSVTFKFVKAGKLCGTNDFPGGSPSRLVAKP